MTQKRGAGEATSATVASLLAESRPTIRSLAKAVEAHCRNRGCESYVKTIYIGFELNGEMVAALYPHAQNIELALALPEDSPHAGLIDATHLTWRTMPVAMVFSSKAALPTVVALLDEAIGRVAGGTHDVDLPTEAFMGRSRRVASRRILGQTGDV